MQLPNRIFFAGVPGSRWSGIAQTIERIPGFNTTDRTPEREYIHHGFTGHKGAYFGRMMEFDARLDAAYIDQAWTQPGRTRLIKSHDWAYNLEKIKSLFPNDWIMLVHRPDDASFNWWKQAGGFDIEYPSYTAYRNDEIMKLEIAWQNCAILKFAEDHNLQWQLFDSQWILDIFGFYVEVEKVFPDIKVTVIK